jgi:glycosyltransferase involved in cell wall biosynthesis
MTATPIAFPSVRIDLHVHSKFSKRPSQWVLQKLGCPESFTEPRQVYDIARERAMDLVTITDHNTIDGALEIAHLPGTFVSEEVTAYFPDNGCKVHVLVYDIDDGHHVEIQKIRENLFDLVAYLRREGIVHILAHPLYSVNDRLTHDHFEKLLLLFRNFEMNGARDDRQSHCLQRVLAGLTPEVMERLSEKHGIVPDGPEPWRKNLTGGSDDHSGLNIARTHTVVPGTPSVTALLSAIDRGSGRVVRQSATPLTLAHNLYGIAYQFYRNKFNLGRYANRDVLMRFLDRSLSPVSETDTGLISKLYFMWSHRKPPRVETDVNQSLMDAIRQETRNLIHENPALLAPETAEGEGFDAQERRWFDFVNQLSNKVMHGFADHLMGHLSGANVFNLFHTVGSAGGLYTLLAPYFVSFSHFNRDRAFIAEVADRFSGERNRGRGDTGQVRVAHFTDTFYEVNGVARTLNQQVEIARKSDKNLTVITCDAGDGDPREGVKHFEPVGIHALPEYPEQKIFYPPFLEMLNYCHEQDFTHIHSATPGPIGLAAVAIAHILNLPISGTYHTALPQYAQYLTGDAAIEDLTWKYALWYYGRMDTVYVPSRATGDELIEKGIAPEKIRLFPRGIDIRRFHPSKRNGYLKKRYDIGEAATKLLYVGRVSREKNLPLLSEVFKSLSAENRGVHLVVVGDGPYKAEMQADLAGLPATFTGYMGGEDLASIYASSDLFVFPSTTDTFGNVVLEAQASGLPVIVTDQGGPRENLVADQTGFVVRGDDGVALLAAVRKLVDDPGLLTAMGRNARTYMEERSFEKAFDQTWRMYNHPGGQPHLAEAV